MKYIKLILTNLITSFKTNKQKSYSMVFIPPMLASTGTGLMDQLLQAGIAASQNVLDPMTWFFIWAWIVQLMMMLFKYLSLIPSVFSTIV